MAIINCPRCGGSKKNRTTGKPCEFCRGTGKVEVNNKELKKGVKREERRNRDKDIL